MAKDKKTKLLEEIIHNPAEASAKTDELKRLGLDPAHVATSAKTAKAILEDPDGADRGKEFAGLAFAVKLALLDLVAAEGAGAFLARLQRDEKDKAVAKAIARAIHEVRNQGMNVADMREKKTVKFDLAAETVPESYVSALDTEGNRLVLLARISPLGRLNVFHVVIGDSTGMQNFEGLALTRGNYRKFISMAEEQMGAKLAPINSDYAAWLIHDAAHRSSSQGLPTPGAYEQGRTMIEAPATQPAHPIEALMDRKDMEHHREALVKKSDTLHTLAECAFWVPDEPALEKLTERLKEVDESKIALDKKQKEQRRTDAARKTLLEYFDDAKRTLWEGRLRETAYVLAATGRMEEAKIAWATGMTLGKKGSDVEKIPFATELVDKIIRHAEHEEEHDHAGHEHKHAATPEMRAQAESVIVKP